MRRAVSLLLLLSLLSACAAPAEADPEPPEAPPQEVPTEDIEPFFDDTGETEDHVLLTLEAPLADGRTLTLEAFGAVFEEHVCGVREVRVYDGEDLIQTVSAYEAIELVWGSAADDLVGPYTTCWSPEDCMETLDLNFDGDTDFGLFGWAPNNTIPYYYWIWDAQLERYQYAFTLQGVEAHPEEGEISSEYKFGGAGSQYVWDYYRPDKDGVLYMVRHVIRTYPETASGRDTERPVWETWEPREGVTIRIPYWHKDDLILVRREVPIREDNADGTVSRFTEIWELKDGELQMTGREGFSYDDQP